MANTHFSLPLLPGPAGADVAEINLPPEKIVGKFLRSNAKPVLAGDFVAWCLRKVLEDQYTDGKSAGGWSKRYPEYGKFIFGDDNMYESLTVSGQIAEALIQYSDTFKNDHLKKAILPRLSLLKDYLKRHYDPEVGGFGLATTRKKRGPAGISTDIRHTAWVVIALWYLDKLGIKDSETDEMLRSAAGYINKILESREYIDKYALTYAVLHKILTTDGLSNIIMPDEPTHRSVLERIEAVLVNRYVNQYASWDEEDLMGDPIIGIDNALSVLVPIQISSCIDKKCAETLKTALHRMCEKSLITLDDETMALPFYKDGDPDIGTTIDLIWCIIKNQDVFIPKKGIVEKMINFIVDPSSRKGKLKFAYPWNLSSALLLATKSTYSPKLLKSSSMYITKMVLDNVRCFDHIEIDLQSNQELLNWTLLLGDNGVGKTTIIRSLAIGLVDSASASALLKELYGDWVRRQAGKQAKAIIRIEFNKKCENGQPWHIQTTIEGTGGDDIKVTQATYPEENFPWQDIFVCGYGAARRAYGSKDYSEYSPIDAVYTLFNYDSPIQNPELILRRLADTEVDLNEILTWFDEVLMLPNGSTQLGLGGITVDGPWGKFMPLGAIGDGYQATLAWVADMLGWVMFYDYNLITNFKSDFCGIVLLDEIEQHLHPIWQKSVIKLLHTRFPKLQFIATTHSPLVASGSQDAAVHVLRAGGHQIERPYGWLAEDVYSMMGLNNTRSKEFTSEVLDKYERLLQKQHDGKASDVDLIQLKQLRKELALLPESDPVSLTTEIVNITNSLRKLKKRGKK